MSRKWSDSTKRSVIIGIGIALALLIYRFRYIIPPFLIAVMLAYILNPLVKFLMVRAKLPRTVAVILIYLVLIAAIGVTSAIFVPNLVEQFRSINLDLEGIAASVSRFFEQPILIYGFSVEFSDIYKGVSSALRSIASPFVSHTISFLIDVASSAAWLLFILVISFYLLKDAQKIGSYLEGLVPPAHRKDVRRLAKEVNAVWSAFLRGQLILCAVVGFVVWVVLWIVGVRNSLVLGIVAGVLEVIPNIGPAVSAIPAVLIAFFQGSSRLNIPNSWFALLVIGLYILIQELENKFLVPYIMGRSLRLHPLVVLVGVIAGASLAGPLGIFLAAPILATARVLGSYAHRKLLDLEPFEEMGEVRSKE